MITLKEGQQLLQKRLSAGAVGKAPKKDLIEAGIRAAVESLTPQERDQVYLNAKIASNKMAGESLAEAHRNHIMGETA